MSAEGIHRSAFGVELQEVYDTECYEPVYNLRVAEYHTYFVGAEEWESGVWAHNSQCAYHELVKGTTNTYDLVIYQQPGWSTSQIADANVKVQAINAAPDKIVVHDPVRTGKEQKVFRTINKLTGTYKDADHIIDLQLGGSDTQSNLWLLDASVNRSMGSSIRASINGLPDGTLIRNLIMKERS